MADLLTLADARKQLNYRDADDTDDDAEITEYIHSLTEVVERYTGKTYGTTTVEETHYGVAGAIWLRKRPVKLILSVDRVDDSMTWDTDLLLLDKERGRLWPAAGSQRLCGDLRITYQAGSEVTPAVNMAARIILQHMWSTQRGGGSGGMRVGGQSDDDGDGGQAPVSTYVIPYKAQEYLGLSPIAIG